MLDYLIKHAVDNVWCSPNQDHQAIIKLPRISPDFGAIARQQVMWERIFLPTAEDRYDVYQIGHVYPRLLGLMSLGNTWKSLAETINESSLMAEVYLDNGVVYPRSECWLRYDDNRNVVLAVKRLDVFPNPVNENVYIRVYSNAYFNSDRHDASVDGTEARGRRVNTDDDVLSLQRRHHEAKLRQGAVLAYHNGYLVADFVPNQVELGDYIEYVWDSSVYRVIDFPIKSLDVFDSTLDKKRKYLLSSDENDNNTIDFEDDIDLYLVRPDSNGRLAGIYYHRNQKDSIRMLTHKDYSVPVQRLLAYQEEHRDWANDINELVVRLYVRKSGFERPLIMDHNRIFELYRLSPEDVRRAMLGIDSIVPEWRAENLENSAYVKLMRHRDNALDPVLVQQAYGYNSMSRLLGDTPTVVNRETLPIRVTLPPALQENATVYEYDVNGYLIDHHYHRVGVTYTCRSDDTHMVEVLSGMGDDSVDVVFGESSVSIDPEYNYRAYVCTLFGQDPMWDWVDVSNTEIVQVGNDRLSFVLDENVDYPAVVSDKKFLAYRFEMDDVGGVYKFTVNQQETHFGVAAPNPMRIPPRRLDVWLNRRPLIEGLDYVLNWPEVTIVNKGYLNDADPQRIDVRATGLCNFDLTLDEPREVGFVEHGYLSHDNRYDVRDDKVLSIIAEGRLMDRNALTFAEDNLGVAVDDVANGTPYAIRETVVGLKDETYLDTYRFREKSMAVDARVSAYMNQKYPQADIPGPSPIQHRHVVYSPFISRLINDLRLNIFADYEIKGHYSNADIRNWMKDYESLLAFDPTEIGVDERYVHIHPHRFPHVVTLNVYEFNFVKRVIDLYFDGRIDLSHFIEVTMPQE